MIMLYNSNLEKFKSCTSLKNTISRDSTRPITVTVSLLDSNIVLVLNSILDLVLD